MKITTSKKNLTPKIKLDPWDTWNADHTLACIILAVLKQYRKTLNGGPQIDNEDVPWNLHRPAGMDDWVVDDFWFKRWDYVLGEMIFAFEKIAERDDIEEYSEKVEARKKEGLRLFAKYFEALWD